MTGGFRGIKQSIAGIELWETNKIILRMEDIYGPAQETLDLDVKYGRSSRHHPDRTDYYEVMRPVWRRRQILRDLPPGSPAGPFVRSS